ncbi:unnamed protein product [Caenorhabditis bovis]|uniref:histone acetyltransferase n=1 Tax=Caenorhabditis bovis TaxID=2654633 RepID=A0A8S1EMZ7_9PELO|nr:unnamed protein product [Caenorhabditis bovis]
MLQFFDRLQRCCESLEHASRCLQTDCGRLPCFKLKLVMAHMRASENRSLLVYLVCRQFLSLCCYHAKGCLVEQFAVPYCLTLRPRMPNMELVALRSRNDVENFPRARFDPVPVLENLAADEE